MPEPSVVAIMLTADRPEMARRAVECFRAQTYSPKTLLIVNSGAVPLLNDPSGYEKDMMEPCYIGADAQTIGELRNRGNADAARHGADILIHWDDDDYSHPNRIAEQVTLLQSSGADAVGCREMLFWRDTPGEAWLYSNPDPRYCLGTSLCYWRKTWERVPFQPLPKAKGGNAEDNEWLKSVSSAGVPAFGFDPTVPPSFKGVNHPRMIARIHSSNTSDYASVVGKSHNWRRVPEWDAYCESVMK